MLVAIIEEEENFVVWGGLIDTPEGVNQEDVKRLWAEYRGDEEDDYPSDAFMDWLLKRLPGSKEIPCAYFIRGYND